MTAMKLEKRETAAMTAEPMAMPFVSAFVVFPTASRSARIWRARLAEPGTFASISLTS